MTVGDIYQLRLNLNHPSDPECINVFYYRVITQTNSISAENVADDFVTNILDAIMEPLANNITANGLTTINGMSNSDFNETNPSVSGGSGTGTPAPAFIAIGYRSQRNGPGSRRSYKRVVGPPSNVFDTTNGRFSLDFQALIETASDIFDDTLTLAGGTLDPCQITGGFVLGVTPTFHFDLTSPWEFDAFPTHQDSRQSYLWLTDAQT